jgi:hypothetical protein
MTESATFAARTIGDPLFNRRRKLGARPDGDALNRCGHRGSERFETHARTLSSGYVYPLDQCHSVGERNLSRPRAIEIATHGPRPFVVIGVRRQITRKVDTPPIQEFVVGGEGDEYR